MDRNKIVLLFYCSIVLLLLAPPVFAQTPHEIGTIGEGKGFGPWSGLFETIGEAAGTFNKIISNIIGVMTISAGIWFIFQFIIGAYGWLAAGAEQQSIQQAQQRITNAVMGLVIVVAAYALIALLGSILGFEILHPEILIPLIGPGD